MRIFNCPFPHFKTFFKGTQYFPSGLLATLVWGENEPQASRIHIQHFVHSAYIWSQVSESTHLWFKRGTWRLYWDGVELCACVAHNRNELEPVLWALCFRLSCLATPRQFTLRRSDVKQQLNLMYGRTHRCLCNISNRQQLFSVKGLLFIPGFITEMLP